MSSTYPRKGASIVLRVPVAPEWWSPCSFRRGCPGTASVDRAGWHEANDLTAPANITLVPLPSYSPELNPVERLWLHLKERFLSHRLLDNYEAIADAACAARRRLLADAGRITSLFSYPWIKAIKL